MNQNYANLNLSPVMPTISSASQISTLSESPTMQNYKFNAPTIQFATPTKIHKYEHIYTACTDPEKERTIARAFQT